MLYYNVILHSHCQRLETHPLDYLRKIIHLYMRMLKSSLSQGHWISVNKKKKNQEENTASNPQSLVLPSLHPSRLDSGHCFQEASCN